jgi:hypothetical protein
METNMEQQIEVPGPIAKRPALPADGVEIVDLGDRLRVTVELPIGPDETPSRRRALALAWEALAGAISESKAKLPPVPVAKPKKKRTAARGTRTGSGSWWQF